MTLTIPDRWEFNHQVAHAFALHVRQSVPGYDEILRLFRVIIHSWRVRPGIFLDFGTGTGEALAAIESEWVDGDRAIGVDSSEAMLERAKGRTFKRLQPQLVLADLTSFEIPQFDVGILTFTLSFIPPSERGALLSRAWRASSPTGMLLFADKISYARPVVSSAIAVDHANFKLSAGISEEDVKAKAASLRGVQDPWELETYLESMRAAGWRDPYVIHLATGFFACVAFAR